MLKVVAAVEPGDVCYEPVLRCAGRLTGDGTLHVVSIYPSPIEWVCDPIRTLESQTAEARRARAEQIESDAARLGVPAPAVVVPLATEVSAGDDVVKHAQHLGAELVVLGTHGRTGLEAWVLGSVAERVVRYAHCDVYVVRAPADPGRTSA
ncbi:MAG: universal stress protein [Myxococcota bacterium]